MREFYAPTRSSIANQDGVISEGEYDVELDFDVNDVNGEYTDELFIDNSSELFSDDVSDTRSFKVYMRNSIVKTDSGNLRFINFGFEIVDLAGSDNSDRICIDILPDYDNAEPFQVCVGTVEVDGVRTKDISVTYKNERGVTVTTVLDWLIPVITETVSDGVRTTRVEFRMSSSDADGFGLFSGVSSSAWVNSVSKIHFRVSGIF